MSCFGKIKRGGILKGKIKFIYLSLIVVVLALCGCCLFAVFNKKEHIAKAVGSSDKEFTFVDSNSNVIVSIEKVAVEAKAITRTGKDVNKNFTTPLYDRYNSIDDNAVTNSMYIRSDGGSNSVYFKNISNGVTNPFKYVVNAYDRQEFVMLNNQIKVSDSGNYYYNPTLNSVKTVVDGEVKTADLAEAILISVGQYINIGDRVGFVEEENGANIQYIGIEARRNGVLLGENEVPGVREYKNNVYEDFVWVIPQIEGNEGYYDILLTYRVNGQISQARFAFYLLFSSSYNESVLDRYNNSYSIFPNLANVSARGSFNLGVDDISGNYPTITYDFTKFKMSYTKTVNGVTDFYDYSYTVAGLNASLVCNKNGSLFKTANMGEIRQNGANIAVVVLTDIGEYNVEFEYIYTGYKPDSSAPEMNLKISNKEFAIHGFDLKYAKAGYNSASLRYVKFACPTNAATNRLGLGLIVPNGYELNEKSSEFNLGLVYEIDNSVYDAGSGSGRTPAYGSINTTTPRKMANFNLIEGLEKQPSAYASQLESNVNFVKTNQGGLWLESIDSYVNEESFYYFSTTLNGENGLLSQTQENKKSLTNMSTFNPTGYYMLFIKVHPAGTNGKEFDFYAAYAFQYSAETPDVKVFEYNGEQLGREIGARGYTNKNVRVSWQLPDIFERSIKVNYYKSANGQYLTRQQLINLSPVEMTNNEGEILGENVPENSGASFLIETKSEGKSATYRTIIIDKEGIKNVCAYSVESAINRQGNVFYRFLKDSAGNNVKLANSITNSNATLWWDDKPSGAKITATYTYTPFVKNNKISVGEVTNNSAWYATNYSLGTTIGDFDLVRAASTSADIDTSNILFGQGIYLFTIADEAGNSCKYMFVIDNTEGYFKVNYNNEGSKESEFLSRVSKLYTDDVAVEVGSHKVIKLERDSANEKNSDLFRYITAAINGNARDFDDLNYYKEGDTNRNVLGALFGRVAAVSSGYDLYLTVRNVSLSVYNDQLSKIADVNLSQNRSYEIKAAGSSVIRSLYLVGVNQLDIINGVNLPTSSNSYLTIEVNTDHSQGMAFYGSNLDTLKILDNLTPSGINGVHRLVYGDDGTKTGIYAAHATGDNYLVFSWYMGNNTKYEVENVSYKFFDLDLNKFGEEQNVFNQFNLNSGSYDAWFKEDGTLLDYIYYYNGLTGNNSNTIYSKNGVSNIISFEDTDRVIAVINLERNLTKAGLYVITRSYGESFDASAEGEKDKKVQYYYFIVDRNGIIGGYISIGLKDNESQYNNFYISGSEQGSIYLKNGNPISYNIYLETNRLPAILNIPVGKYFYYGNNFNFASTNMRNGADYFGSEYYAGELDFEVYFSDYYNIFKKNTDGNVYFENIYDSVKANASTTNSGFYTINLKDNIYSGIRDKFFPIVDEQAKEIDDDYIWLEGDYIVVVKDKVEGVTHQRAFAFRIKHSAPETDIYSLFERPDKNTTKQDSIFVADSNSKILTTSEEFVVLNMYNQEVVSSHLKAELDLNYLFVTRNFDGQQTVYINYNHGRRTEYSNLPGVVNIDEVDGKNVLQTESEGKTNRKILLDSLLRDAEGNIIKENLTKKLEYAVTIRYNLVNVTNPEEVDKYKDCYYYYDYSTNPAGELVAYFESTYRVVIDRTAPQTTINKLLAADKLLNEQDKQNLFENSYIETADGIYFVNRLKAYYENKNRADIYAFYVDNSTSFVDISANAETQDVYSVQYRPIDPSTAELVLPLSPRISYTKANQLPSTFGALLDGETAGFYEIVEQDRAGNTSQFVVFYDPDKTANSVKLNLQATFRSSQQNNGTLIEDKICINFASSGEYTIFQLEQNNSNSVEKNTLDMFFNLQIVKVQNGQNNMVENLSTNLTSNFDNTENGLLKRFVDAIINNGYGSYIISVKSHIGMVEYRLDYFEESDVQITLSNLVVRDNGVCYLDLSKAKTDKNGITYYAKTITLRRQADDFATYYCNPANNFNYYYNYNYNEATGLWEYSNPVENNFVTTLNGQPLNGAYVIIANVAEKLFYYHFNTDASLTDNQLSFGENGDAAYTLTDDNVYYSFNQANVKFNSASFTLNLTYSILCNGRLQTGNGNTLVNGPITYNNIKIMELVSENGLSTLKIYPYFANNNKTGAIITVQVGLVYIDGTSENPINIVVDTDTGPVSLTSKNSVGSGNEFNVDLLKQNDDIFSTQFAENLSGQMWLNWTVSRNDYFVYTYTLYETLQNGEVRAEEFGSQTSRQIDTMQDSTGVYRFVIDIYNTKGEFLGRKVYTFSVQSETNMLYSVNTSNNFVLEQNSNFKMVPDVFETATSNTFGYYGQLGVDMVELTKIATTLPLYVYNQEMSVQTAKDIDVEAISWTVFDNSYAKFTLYRIYSTSQTYNLYVGLLYVKPTQQIVDDLIVETVAEGVTSSQNIRPATSLEYTFTGSGSVFTLKGKQVVDNGLVNSISLKNSVVLSIWFRTANSERKIQDVAVNSEFYNGTINFAYELKGSGQFMFEFKDLAGNVHNFNFNSVIQDDDQVVSELDIIVLKEVVLLANGINAIDNAYYNGEVNIQIFSPNMYDMRGITLSATLNGEPYVPISNSQYSYAFVNYGTYRITASATVNEQILKKELVFTIIDENEVRQSLDLTSLFNYNITQIKNNRGEVVTKQLVDLLNSRTGKDKYLLTYNFLVENAQLLNIGSGKQQISIEYSVQDGIYPTRVVEFSFAMNNETPNIMCDVKSGDSTTKSFTITFNPGIIYEQVGNSAIYINDEIVCEINAYSPYSVQTHTVSYKNNGAGNYYIVLRGSSGAVHFSYKVVVKEPLNTWSIILIVVVVLIIATIVGVIIFLRVKMKIR